MDIMAIEAFPSATQLFRWRGVCILVITHPHIGGSTGILCTYSLIYIRFYNNNNNKIKVP